MSSMMDTSTARERYTLSTGLVALGIRYSSASAQGQNTRPMSTAWDNV